MRQRGVRAVVDCLRLRKEHQQLSSERVSRLGDNRNLRANLQHMTALNSVLRDFIRHHTGRGALTENTGNSWNYCQVFEE
jgi:hypothetical protein